MSVLIIAEAGVNHNGSIELAKQLVDQAKLSGADCIKFQTFNASAMTTKKAHKADYQTRNMNDSTDSQLNMLKKLELTYDEFIELRDYSVAQGIIFLSTAFDDLSVEFLNDLDMKLWKIPSGEITNLPYLQKIASFNKPVILSTGMATIDEIAASVKVFEEAGVQDITILHCTTDYPAKLEEVNLRAMNTLETIFGYPVGYSDHTAGIEIPIAAVAMGACVIEKHFTLDKTMEGPDHKASLEPHELKQMVDAIRNVELGLGSRFKGPSESELGNRLVARKSLVAGRNIRKGDILTAEDISIKRPGTGISPMQYYQVIGTKAIRDFEEEEILEV